MKFNFLQFQLKWDLVVQNWIGVNQEFGTVRLYDYDPE